MVSIHTGQLTSLFEIKSLVRTNPDPVTTVGFDEKHVVGTEFAVFLVVFMADDFPVAVAHLQTTGIGVPQPGVSVGGEDAVAVVAVIFSSWDEFHKTLEVGVITTVSLSLKPDEKQSVGIHVQLTHTVGEQKGVVA